jgi:hypothetical protein
MIPINIELTIILGSHTCTWQRAMEDKNVQFYQLRTDGSAFWVWALVPIMPVASGITTLHKMYCYLFSAGKTEHS